MRKIVIGGMAAVLGVSTAVAGGAFAAAGGNGPALWVNGGGQMIASGSTGPGDTIAFNAQQLGDGTARGQLQYSPHVDTATPQFHGVVTCVSAIGGDNQGGGTATFGGFANDANQTPFRVDVTDAGHGDGTDAIALAYNVDYDQTPCDGDAADNRDLGRGNVTIHNNTD